jgi:hypothetical protein
VVVRCVECAREADERFTIAEHWTWWSDGCGALVPFCPECAESEFAHRVVRLDSADALSATSRGISTTRAAGTRPTDLNPWLCV